MKIKDLANYCKTIKINCDICEFKDECEKMTDFLNDQSPYGVVDFVKNNNEI